MSSKIKAIIGLGNPGPNYIDTRHNAGAWLVEQLSSCFNTPLRKENKFFGSYGKALINSHCIHLLIPETYMNRSGQSVAALCKFYKLEPKELLIAHDELDFDAGVTRLKLSGGHGGHNGLRDIIKALNSKEFYRARIGIGHPGNKNDVSDYVLKKPGKDERISIDHSIDHTLKVIDDIINGNITNAMQVLHSK